MKLFITTATAALFGAGMAFAGGDMSRIDADASGDVSLEEAQAYDPSITTNSFSEFDADGDGALSETEFAAWADEMSSATGQGDVDDGLGAPTEADTGLTAPEDSTSDYGVGDDADLNMDPVGE